MNAPEWIRREQARIDAFKVLAHCYHPPDGGLKKTVDGLTRSLQDICEDAHPFTAKMKTELENIDIGALQIDHARLFVGPYQLLAPPYGSVYLDGARQVMGESTLDVIETYRASGVEASETFLEPPDHVAAELEFLHYLLVLSLKCLAGHDFEGAVAFREQAESFLQRHLGAWVGPFTANVEARAATGFYRNLARATKLFVRRGLGGHQDLGQLEFPRETV